MWRSARNVRNTMGSEAMVVRLRPECGGRPEMFEIRWGVRQWLLH